MKLLLTGAAGFIGSQVARAAVADRAEVHVVLRPTTDRTRLLELVQDLRIHEADLLDADGVRRLVRRVEPDVCIHAAWYAVPGRYLDAPENLDLLQASIRLVRELVSGGCRRVVGVGTCFEYALDDSPVDEASPVRATSMYAASKLALSLLLEQITARSEATAAWARLFYQYGPFEPEERLVPTVARRLLRGEEAPVTAGAQVRDFLHVSDVGRALWQVAQSDLVGPVNIGSGAGVTVRELVLAIADIVGRRDLVRLGALPYAPADPMFVRSDNRRLRGTGWTPQWDLDGGLRDTVAWWERWLERKTTRSVRPTASQPGRT
jgi:nucleoside-diphosphate-sugar epimerase